MDEPQNLTADEQENVEEASQFAPGELCPMDATDAKIELVDDEAGTVEEKETCIKNLSNKSSQRDLTSRRIQIRDVWKNRLFWQGKQRILPYRGGWVLPGQVAGMGTSDDSQDSQETNITLAHGQGIVSALTSGLPSVRFEAQDQSNPAEVSAAENGEKARLLIERNNDMIVRQGEVARFGWTDEVTYIYVRSVYDGQRFGFEDDNAQQDEASYLPETGGQGPDESNPVQASPESPNDDSSGIGGESSQENGSSVPQTPKRQPRNEEVIEVWGALEIKVGMQTNSQSETPYLRFSREKDLTLLKSAYPEKAGKLKAMQVGSAESEIERLARISVNMGIRPSSTTSDSMSNMATEERVWIRPGFFTEEKEKRLRDWLYQVAPNGLMSVIVSNEVCEARNESMDEHWTQIHMQYGDGNHRPALCAPIIPLNEKLNDAMDELHECYMHLLQRVWVDSEAVDAKALNETKASPKQYFNIKSKAGKPISENFFTESEIKVPPGLIEYIDKLFADWSQFLSSDFPALFGGNTGSNDTSSGIAQQRNSALGRVGLAWRAMRAGYADIISHAVQCAAKYRNGMMSGSLPRKDGSGMMQIAIDSNDLKGKTLCFPDTDENFPVTWIEKQGIWTKIVEGAATNPVIAQMLSSPQNMRIAKDFVGVPELVVPGAQADEKQRGQIMELLQSPPQPNPEFAQAQMEMQTLGPQAPPEAQQMAQQAMSQIPQLLSTVPIDPDVDDMASMIQTTKDWANSNDGIKAKATNPGGYLNVITQMKEREANIAQQQQAQQPKPPSESIGFKDLAGMPSAQMQMAKQAGIQLNPQEIQQKQVADQQQAAAELEAKKKQPQGMIQ
jgi:hypothetical protein